MRAHTYLLPVVIAVAMAVAGGCRDSKPDAPSQLTWDSFADVVARFSDPANPDQWWEVKGRLEVTFFDRVVRIVRREDNAVFWVPYENLVFIGTDFRQLELERRSREREN